MGVDWLGQPVSVRRGRGLGGWLRVSAAGSALSGFARGGESGRGGTGGCEGGGRRESGYGGCGESDRGHGSRVGGRGVDGAALSPAGAVARGTHPLSPPNPPQHRQPAAAGAGVSLLPTVPRPLPGAPILWPRDPNLLPGRFPVSGCPSAAHRSLILSLHLLPFTFAGVLSPLFCPARRLLASLFSSNLLPWLILPRKVWYTSHPSPQSGQPD